MKYALARDDIKNGDVLMYKGRSLTSKIVKLVVGSQYSHAGIAVWWNQRLMVMEAIHPGVVLRPASLSIERYNGEVEWFQLIEPLNDEERHVMIITAQEELGKEYAWGKAIKLAFRLLFGLKRISFHSLRRAAKLFCSEYVSAVYAAIGRDLRPSIQDSFTTPDDLAKSPKLRRVDVLHIPKE